VSAYEETQHCISLTTFLEATDNIKLSCQIPDKMCFHLDALIIALTGRIELNALVMDAQQKLTTTDPTSRQRGRPTSTNPQLSKYN
jgi:hypothetical protein